jgi:hypothetical protein
MLRPFVVLALLLVGVASAASAQTRPRLPSGWPDPTIPVLRAWIDSIYRTGADSTARAPAVAGAQVLLRDYNRAWRDSATVSLARRDSLLNAMLWADSLLGPEPPLDWHWAAFLELGRTERAERWLRAVLQSAPCDTLEALAAEVRAIWAGPSRRRGWSEFDPNLPDLWRRQERLRAAVAGRQSLQCPLVLPSTNP